MASLSLKISIVEKDVVKTMQFDPNTAVFDACRLIRDKITEANLGQRKFIQPHVLFSSHMHLLISLSLSLSICNIVPLIYCCSNYSQLESFDLSFIITDDIILMISFL